MEEFVKVIKQEIDKIDSFYNNKYQELLSEYKKLKIKFKIKGDVSIKAYTS